MCQAVSENISVGEIQKWLEHTYMKHWLAQMHHLQHSTKVVVFRH